jgi:Pvc16 N-terminal domain
VATTDAIAYLGDTLVKLLQDGLSGLVASTNIFLSTPSEFKNIAPTQPSVTIFLYNFGVNGEMRNPPRRTLASGATRPPPLPLELHFLITPWAQFTRDAYMITGVILALLHGNPVLTVAELLGPDGTWAPGDAVDAVELILESLPVEDYYYIWDPADIPYRLSLAFLARLIGIDSVLASDEKRGKVIRAANIKPK